MADNQIHEREVTEALWQLLDDIDTIDDQIKPHEAVGYELFREKVLRIVKLRHEYLKSDGHRLEWPEPVEPSPNDQPEIDRIKRALHQAEVDAGIASPAPDFDYQEQYDALVRGKRPVEAIREKKAKLELFKLLEQQAGTLLTWEECLGEVKRLVTSDQNVRRVGSQRVPENYREYLERALQKPTLVEALSMVSTWDTENAVHQAFRNVPEDKRVPSHGGLWETCSGAYFRELLQRWGISPDCPRGAYPPHVDPSKLPVPEPIPMLLSCPVCHARHFDEGEFATKPHHSHACQAHVVIDGKRRRCGHVWRPALVPTVGVEALPGFLNDP